MKTAVVCGAGGFIGSHLVNRLKADGFWVRAADLKAPVFETSNADEFVEGDLRDPTVCGQVIDKGFDEVYQLAADMGGAGYLFTGANDATVMHNSAQINLNVLETCRVQRVGRIFYSSSACVYPERNQLDPSNPVCTEDSVYPADPDSEYGWEKLFSERLYESYRRNFDMTVRIARYHNVYGPCGTWAGGREKVPAALCRKVATARAGTDIEIWGDGYQTRSFLYVDDCIEASLRLMRGDWAGPVNIGSSEMISINALAALIMEIADKNLGISHIEGPQGVRGRCSDNKLIQEKLGWLPTVALDDGLRVTYNWICEQVISSRCGDYQSIQRAHMS
jgi:nucleoside-diphosphate-sugar epimerase